MDNIEELEKAFYDYPIHVQNNTLDITQFKSLPFSKPSFHYRWSIGDKSFSTLLLWHYIPSITRYYYFETNTHIPIRTIILSELPTQSKKIKYHNGFRIYRSNMTFHLPKDITKPNHIFIQFDTDDLGHVNIYDPMTSCTEETTCVSLEIRYGNYLFTQEELKRDNDISYKNYALINTVDNQFLVNLSSPANTFLFHTPQQNIELQFNFHIYRPSLDGPYAVPTIISTLKNLPKESYVNSITSHILSSQKDITLPNFEQGYEYIFIDSHLNQGLDWGNGSDLLPIKTEEDYQQKTNLIHTGLKTNTTEHLIICRRPLNHLRPLKNQKQLTIPYEVYAQFGINPNQ